MRLSHDHRTAHSIDEEASPDDRTGPDQDGSELIDAWFRRFRDALIL